jgi:hypothetical protein
VDSHIPTNKCLPSFQGRPVSLSQADEEFLKTATTSEKILQLVHNDRMKYLGTVSRHTTVIIWNWVFGRNQSELG